MSSALICDNDPQIQKNISLILKSLNLDTVTPISLEEALNYLEVEEFEVVIVNETFANENPRENRIIKYVINLPMYRRRGTMLTIIGNNYKTSDRLQAFAKGADLLINTKDLSNFLQIFKRAYSEYLSTYRQYKEILSK